MGRRSRVYSGGLLTIVNKTLTLADTEYSQALPLGTIRFTIKTRGAHDVRMAFVTGKVAAPTAPYVTIEAAYYLTVDHILLTDNRTLYLASSDAGTVVEILAWSVI